jgi:transcriptional regulator with XRE-family HTH domain
MMKAKPSRQLGCAASHLEDFGNLHGGECGVVPRKKQPLNVGPSRTSYAGLCHNHGMQLSSTIGARLRALRIERGLNQVDVAAAVDMSRSHLSKIEGNQDTPSRAKLAALASFFGVSMDYLETGSSPPGSQGPDNSIYSDDDFAWARLGRELDAGQRSAVFDFIERLAAIGRPTNGRRNGRKRRRNG